MCLMGDGLRGGVGPLTFSGMAVPEDLSQQHTHTDHANTGQCLISVTTTAIG